MKRQILSIICILFSLISCTNTDQSVQELNFSHNAIEYWGRVDTTSHSWAELYWSGSMIKLNFEGSKIETLLEDEHGENYFNVFLDGKQVAVWKPDSIKSNFVLDSLQFGKHIFQLYKRNEYDKGYTKFYGFKVHGKVLPKDNEKLKTIEFYGNSITAGYAIHDSIGLDRPDSIFTDNYCTYAAITARHFNAKYHMSCKSGIGIMISWWPQNIYDIYDKLNPNTKSIWDFQKYQPDILVVNLLQNDSKLVTLPNHESFKYYFKDKAPNEEQIIQAYVQFIKTLRGHYPNAKIICALGSMSAVLSDSPWPTYIQKAAEIANDEKLYTFTFEHCGLKIHPLVKEHKVMADSLIAFIETIGWQ